jgi:Zinc dependent phospholipase C
VKIIRTGASRRNHVYISVALIFAVLLALPQLSSGYAVLTHEAIIDAEWQVSIRPLLLARFPHSTEDDLQKAQAYAYGGSIIQDLGYYPFGSKFFTNLVHYVRTADFVLALLRNSRDIDEYAFALGSLAHFTSDNDGHRIGVNRIVPKLYPNLQRKYGNSVSYDEDPGAHLKTEFALDVIQVAKHHYAPAEYHQYIGFEVSKDLLQRAFSETYSLDLTSVFSDLDLSIATYRKTVSSLIPKATKVAWQMKKGEIQKDVPGITRNRFIYNLSRASFKKDWSGTYTEPGWGTKLLLVLIRLIPKIGPFKALAFRMPSPADETLFMNSFNATVQNYSSLIRAEESSGKFGITNDNLDTNTVTAPGEYPLADATYAELVDRLSKGNFGHVTPELRTAILSYYSNLNADYATKKNKKKWATLVRQLESLKANTSTLNGSPIPIR